MIELFAWLLAAPLLLALAIFCVEVTAGLKALPIIQSAEETERPDCAVLIPAHNEEDGIAATLAALTSELGSSDRALVVADNCDDDTAARARGAGAEVVERHDPDRRGKGYALAFGRDHLAAAPPSVVVVLDADSTLAPGSLAKLVAGACGGLPAQAKYLMLARPGSSPLVRISSFAFAVKNVVRNRALMRLGGTALLTGTGMAFPWSCFATAPLATGDVVEDFNLTLGFAENGLLPQLIENATVVSAAAARRDTTGQRRRWEHGFIAHALAHAPALLRRGGLPGGRARRALGLHLLVPPLALLFLLAGAVLAASLITGRANLAWGPTLPLVVALGLASLLTVAAWRQEGRNMLPLHILLFAPLYVLWKVPIYLGFLFARETRWIRTARSVHRSH